MKKSFTLVLVVFVFLGNSFSQTRNVGIGTTTPDASSLLELKSNNKGLLVPRLTTAQRLAISNPADALLVYDLTAGCFFITKAHNGFHYVQVREAMRVPQVQQAYRGKTDLMVLPVRKDLKVWLGLQGQQAIPVLRERME